MKSQYIIYLNELKDNPIVKKYSTNEYRTFSSVDPRSAVYLATGIAAQTNQSVLVILSSDNSSRSAFTGLTEAYYRNLRVAILTLGDVLNYSQELNDVVNGHYVVKEASDLDNLIISKYPAHIELLNFNSKLKKYKCIDLQRTLSNSLKKEHYLYFGKHIDIEKEIEYSCKIVDGGNLNSNEGSLSNVLGASLAKIHKKYIALLTEEEFINDINSIGNVNVNDSLIFIIIAHKENKYIKNIAYDLNYNFYSEKRLNSDILDNVLCTKRKTIILITE